MAIRKIFGPQKFLAIRYHNYIMYCYSTITTWTKEGELDAFRNMLEKVSFK